MAEKEIYHLDLVIDLKGDESTKSKLSAMDRYLEQTQRRTKILDKMSASPAIKINDKATSRIEKITSSIDKMKTMVASPTIKIKDKVSGELGIIRSGISKTISAATSLQGVLLGVGGAWAGVVKPMQIAGDFEQTQMAFTTMLKSAQKANSFLTQAQNMANATPFDFPQLADASKKMLAFGWNVKQILPDLTTIGDAASGLGLGAEGINQITLALGQMKAKGRVQGDEMLQLTEAGVPATKILQEQLGLTAKQVANIGNAGISSDKAIRALLTGMNKRFGGMMQNQAKTALGLMSTLKDTFENKLMNPWGQGLWSGIKPGLTKVTQWLDKNDKKVTELGNLFKKAGHNISSFIGGGLENAQKRLSKLMDTKQWKNADLGGKITLAWDKVVAEPFSSWWNGSGKTKINKVASGMGSAIGGAIGGGIVSFLDALGGKSDKVGGAGTTAGGAFTNAFLQAFDTGKIVEKLISSFKNANLNAIKDPNASNIAKAGIMDYMLLGSLGGATLLKGGAKVAKGGMKAGKWFFGKGGAKKASSTAEEMASAASAAGSTASKASSASSKASKTGDDLKQAAQSFRKAADESRVAEKLRKTSQDNLNKSIKNYNDLVKKAKDIIDKGGKIPEDLSAKINKAKTKVDTTRDRTIKYGTNANVKKETYDTARSTFKGAREASKVVPEAVENTSRASKFFKFAGKGIKGIPIVGGALTLAGAGLQIATSSNKKKATVGAAGNIAGGLAGAKAGALAGGTIGSIIPGVGTAVGAGVGGIAGGIAGSIGGEKALDWVYDKTGPAVKHLKTGFKDAKKSVQTSFQGLGKWFGTNVSTPVSNSFNNAKQSIQSKWSNTKTWFNNKVGTPFKNGAINAINFTVGVFAMGKDAAKRAWAPYGQWLSANVFQPIKNKASDVGAWVGQKFSSAKTWTQNTWSSVSGWFGTNVATPIKNGASSAASWIGQKFGSAKSWAQSHWASFSGWWSTNVGTPVSNVASSVGSWIGQKFSAAKDNAHTAWVGFSGWWSKNVSTPVQDVATTVGSWIGDKFSAARTTAESAWTGFSSWFAKHISGPVSDFIDKATKRGEQSIGLKPSSNKKTVKKRANGGIINGPQFSLIGEAGTEAVIPLSSSRRNRGLSLWQQAGKMLGVRMFANGGIVGNGTSGGSKVASATANVSTSIALGSDALSQFKQYGTKINTNLSSGINDSKQLSTNSINKVTSESQGILNNFSQKGHIYGSATANDIAKGVNGSRQVPINSVSSVTNSSKGVLNAFSQKGHVYGIAINTDIAAGIQSSMGNVTSIVKTLTDKVINQFKTGFGIHSPSRVFYKLAQYIPQGFVKGLTSKDMGNFIKKWVGDMTSMAGGAMGGNVSGWLSSALAVTGTPMNWMSGLLRLVQAESGGNPLAWNPQSVNGEHATGLLQTLGSTFNQYAVKGLGEITNPIANAAAAINYIKSTYGSVYNTPLFKGGKYVGYATGTDNAKPGLARINEKGWEFVDFTGGEQVLTHNKSVSLMNKAANSINRVKNAVNGLGINNFNSKDNTENSTNPVYYTSQPQMAVSGGYGDINVDVQNTFNDSTDVDSIVEKATAEFARKFKAALLNKKK
ncbi:tape measure protein [Clostridium tyrobutyricum]|uniref:tape measure protein n=1 Tax=Clostridium tyrobutyricum TaxID=1519 RepID=UPI000319E0E6|nr:tape measure protein [Clostridium tyrobutyricum]